MRSIEQSRNTLHRGAYTVNSRQRPAGENRRFGDGLHDLACGLWLALPARVRSFLLVAAMLAVAGWGVVHLCAGEAIAAEPRLTLASAGPQVIAGVALDGHGLATAGLRGVLATLPGTQLDAARLTHDRDALRDTLVARGYLAARVSAPAVTLDASGAAFVTFAIAQGPLYRVRSVAVTGASARETGIITLATGDVALAERIASARVALADRLAARGKRGEVSAHVVPDDAAAAVDVELAVASPVSVANARR
ncbi:MAG TPA: POTRA domain-containing protein [Kofleriaceae bacterium]|jgi:hypothetical protein